MELNGYKQEKWRFQGGVKMDVKSQALNLVDLEKALEEKSRFLAYISHELRTPLNGIFGMIQLLQTTELDEEQQEYLHVLRAATGRMNRLITNLMHYSFLYGREDYVSEYQTILLKDSFRQLIEMEKIELTEKQMSVEVSISPSVSGEIQADAFMLDIVLSQIIDNAIKYSYNGQITISASISEEQANILLIEIVDEGLGFDVADKRENHSGLGFKIISMASALSNFQCDFDSKLGFGTRVILKVPYREGHGVEAYSKGISVGRNQKHVLIIDDDENGRVLLSLLCRKLGMSYDVANSGEEALGLARIHGYDLVFVDIQMPEMDGIQVLKSFRQMARHREVPVLAVTAYALKGDEERFLAEGFDGYIAKPIEFTKFEEITRSVLQMHY